MLATCLLFRVLVDVITHTRTTVTFVGQMCLLICLTASLTTYVVAKQTLLHVVHSSYWAGPGSSETSVCPRLESTALLGPVSVGVAFSLNFGCVGLAAPIAPSVYYCTVAWDVGGPYVTSAAYVAGATAATIRCGSVTLPAPPTVQSGRPHSTTQQVTLSYGPSPLNSTSVLDGPGILLFDFSCRISMIFFSGSMHVCACVYLNT